MKKIFVTVSGGCAYVTDDTLPDGFHLEIIDFDNIAAGDAFPPTEAKDYFTTRGLYEPTQAPQPRTCSAALTYPNSIRPAHRSLAW